jgi:hypothetical protein
MMHITWQILLSEAPLHFFILSSTWRHITTGGGYAQHKKIGEVEASEWYSDRKSRDRVLPEDRMGQDDPR